MLFQARVVDELTGKTLIKVSSDSFAELEIELQKIEDYINNYEDFSNGSHKRSRHYEV
jgi:hypothetical protein